MIDALGEVESTGCLDGDRPGRRYRKGEIFLRGGGMSVENRIDHVEIGCEFNHLGGRRLARVAENLVGNIVQLETAPA